jgi:ubiquitin-protein ligase
MSLWNDDRRLYREERAMGERWPDARLVYDEDQELLYWELTVVVEGRRLPSRIEYPDDFPCVPPELRSLVDLDHTCDHVLFKNKMCWIDPNERHRTRDTWVPGRDTAAMVATVAHVWWRAYLVWEVTGKWPEVYDHRV